MRFRLMPSCIFGEKQVCQSCRSWSADFGKYRFVFGFTQILFQYSKVFLRPLIKYLVNGHAAPVWFSRSINLSSSLAVTFLLESIPLRSSIQQWNFFFGSAKVSSLVLMLHPRTMSTSDRLPSSANLSNERQSSHCIFPMDLVVEIKYEWPIIELERLYFCYLLCLG